jgi:hypothetical protein
MVYDAGCKQEFSRLQIAAIRDLTAEPGASAFDVSDQRISNLDSVRPKLFAPDAQ